MEHRERELKFDVPDGWNPPDFDDLAPKGGAREHDTARLEATYYDTAAHDLLRSGVTLRRRRGGADEGWHLKVPAGDARTEFGEPLSGRGVPATFRKLTEGLTGRRALAPIATLRTRREIHRFTDDQ